VKKRRKILEEEGEERERRGRGEGEGLYTQSEATAALEDDESGQSPRLSVIP
jgi:hypothetical protein